MNIDDTSKEIDHLLAEIEPQLEMDRTPEHAARLKLALDRLGTLTKLRAEAIDKVDGFIKLYKPISGEIDKYIKACKGAKGFIKERRKVNEMVAIIRHGLVVTENAARDSGLETWMISEVVKSHRTLLKKAENLRESLGLLPTARKRFKALFPATFQLLSRQRIRKPPGTRWLQFVEFFFSPKTVERTFRPIAADWQYEHFGVLNKGRNFKVRWIALRYHYAFLKAIGLSKLLSVIEKVVSLIR